MPLYRDGRVYDVGEVAGGSPPDFDGAAYGARPAPYVEPVRNLPRLGKVVFVDPPITLDGGITPNAPKGAGEPGAPIEALRPVSATPQPILTAAATTSTRIPGTVPTRVDWRLVVGGSLALVLVWWLLAGRDP